jgi:hypothetical protein
MDKLSLAMEFGDKENTTEAKMLAYLAKAENTIIRRLDPLGVVGITAVPEKYEVLQCELAGRYSFRAGGEGEISHAENGVTRNYGSVNDEDLLREIMPFAKVM